MHKHIYIVEDEAIVALEMKRAIEKLGYIFAGMAANYDDALQGIKATSPDLILMDITLKYSRSGIEVAKEVDREYSIPIIFLTSITDEATMYDAIATNPVGYLLKPFRREELHSMILLGLYKATQQTQIKTDMFPLGHGYYYHLEEKLLFCGERHIPLGKKEEKLLTLLVEAKGEGVSFKILEDIIWEGNLVSQSAFRTLLYRLNLKLEYKLIESLPTYGCRLLLPES
ncbi:MAG: response regulator [Epsilonproteobacteria bacterium]|nr:response regulator [Campylobacterota bacterium]